MSAGQKNARRLIERQRRTAALWQTVRLPKLVCQVQVCQAKCTKHVTRTSATFSALVLSHPDMHFDFPETGGGA